MNARATDTQNLLDAKVINTIANKNIQNSVSITIGGSIPFYVVYNLSKKDISHTNGSDTIFLNAGFYLIFYLTSAQNIDLAETGTKILLNGVPFFNNPSVVHETCTANFGATGTEYIIKIDADNTPIELLNDTELTISYNTVNLIIKKLKD